LIESPGFDQVGRVNFYFKKTSKRCRFRKKTKVNGLQLGYQVNLPGRPGHDFSYFFINPARFQPRVPSRPAGPGRAGFQNYDFTP
jgi:hypothetical protein